MGKRYIVFDVETPNSANDRMSSIGIAVVEDRTIVKEYYSLINPETHFDGFNIKLTGITPEQVADKPSFADAWPEIKDIMSSGLLVGHNAPFDMSVLGKCLRDYQIEWMPYVYYACTCNISRKADPDTINHKLNTLCDVHSIKLDNHHNALSDAKACAELLIHYINEGVDPEDFIRNYDLLCQHTLKEPSKPRISEETQQLLDLKALLADISDDGVLLEQEIKALRIWLHENESLKGQFPFDKVFDTVEAAMEDGVLEGDELNKMLELFEKITDPLSHVCNCSGLDIDGKSFCLSGDFEYGKKAEVEEYFIKRGGILAKSVNKKTDYLIVGKHGSAMWSTGNYGNKVKKAMELQEKGIPIQIIKEEDITFQA